MTWEETRARLERFSELLLDGIGSVDEVAQAAADIRAALERVEELEEANKELTCGEMQRLLLRAEAAEAKLAKVVAFVEQSDNLCNCGSFDSDQMVTRAECSDCRRAALAAAKGE